MSKKYFIFILPGCLILALLGAEIYFRIKSEHDFSAVNGRWLEPYLSFGNFKKDTPSTPASAAGYKPAGLIYQWEPREKISNLLSRAPAVFGEAYPISPERESKEKWVIIMGGSGALGDGSWPKRFPGLLQNELRKTDLELRLFTAATRSFVSSQERVALELYVLPLKPNAVVFLHGFNDMNITNTRSRPGDPYNMGVTYARYENALFGLLQWASDRSRLVERFTSRSVLRTFSDGWKSLPRKEKVIFTDSAAAVYEDNVRRMARRCEQEKVRCLFLLQPFRDFSDDFGEESVRMAYKVIAEAFKRNPLKGMARFHDLALPYSKHPEFFADEVHMTGEGQTAVAKEAAGLLRQAGFSSGSRANP